jgi:aminopeptidase N
MIRRITILFMFVIPAFLAVAGGPSVLDSAHYYMGHKYNVLEYTLNLDLYNNFITPYPKGFPGREDVQLRVDTALNSIELNAVNSSLDIDSVGLAGVSFTHFSDTLKVNLNRTYNPGETLTVRIWYKHLNVADQAFYASGGYVFTDSPPEGARNWFPCWDRPSDKALTDITVKVPAEARLGSNGLMADSIHSADTVWYNWISINPVATYLVSLSGKMNWLVSISFWHHPANPSDSIPFRLYYKPGEIILTAQEQVPLITDFYTSKFGEYPFEKIGFATLNSTFPWGGMENQTLVNLMPGGYNDIALMAHEHSHQWFGDLITCGTWADVWLNEGFATYCTDLWYEYKNGYPAYKNRVNSEANFYLAHNPGWALYNSAWAIHTPSGDTLYNTATSYDKGSCVLHQLRYVLGDSLFFEVMHSYATDTAFMFGNAVTADFVSKVNELTGYDYSWFFNEWVYGPNHPVYENEYSVEDQGNGTWKVMLGLMQVQTNCGFFRMPVEALVSFSDGTDTLMHVLNNVNPQVCEFLFNKQPVELAFDPSRQIVLKQATTVVAGTQGLYSDKFSLLQNEPNPFRNRTTFTYSLKDPSDVVIRILDSRGTTLSEQVHEKRSPGTYKFDLNGDNLAAGVYYCKMEAGPFTQTVKFIKTR